MNAAEAYHDVRQREGRLLADDVVRGLPDSGGHTAHPEEWRVRGRSLQRVIRMLSDRPRTILDAGCGNGWLAARLAEAGHSVTGLDTGATELEQAKRVFADRPVRAAGHALTSTLLDEWNPSYPDSFHADPPNATVSVFGDDDKTILDAVVTLKNPTMQGADLVFDVDVLEGSLTGANGPAAVFIDIIGRPLTPLSFAGVARRTAYRGAWYAGAAAAAAPRPACGYPPYPPCY